MPGREVSGHEIVMQRVVEVDALNALGVRQKRGGMRREAGSGYVQAGECRAMQSRR